jgi:hypothetical protein
MKPIVRAAIVAASVLAGVGAGAQGGGVLASLAPGEWELHEIGQRDSARLVCLRNPQRLVHMDFPLRACRRSLVAQDGRTATVRFICPGLGNGVTRLSVESGSIVRLQAQGLARGAPFDHDIEARRIGPCRRGVTASLPD